MELSLPSTSMYSTSKGRGRKRKPYKKRFLPINYRRISSREKKPKVYFDELPEPIGRKYANRGRKRGRKAFIRDRDSCVSNIPVQVKLEIEEAPGSTLRLSSVVADDEMCEDSNDFNTTPFKVCSLQPIKEEELQETPAFVVQSMLRKESRNGRPFLVPVSREELVRRTEGPEGFAKEFLLVYLRRGSGLRQEIIKKLKDLDINFNKMTKEISSFSYLSEGDCKQMGVDFHALLHQFMQPDQLLTSISRDARSNLITTRAILDIFKEEFNKNLLHFDLVTHGFGENMVNTVIDFLVSAIESKLN